MEDYKIIKNVKSDENIEINLIFYNDKKYIMKKAKTLERIKMLKNEVNILNKLSNTNVCPKLFFYEFNKNNNYIVIEYIYGKPINSLNLLNDKVKISLILKIIETIKEIHKLNIIHCDLKPDNILLDLNKNVKIIDFGISINDGVNIFKGYGSARYCSKYQVLNETLSRTTDIYSLGIIFYELLKGVPPFFGTKDEIKVKKANNEYVKFGNVYVDNILSKLFDNNDNKYLSIEEFEKDLKYFYSVI